jgi:hypothetical protein
MGEEVEKTNLDMGKEEVPISLTAWQAVETEDSQNHQLKG